MIRTLFFQLLEFWTVAVHPLSFGVRNVVIHVADIQQTKLFETNQLAQAALHSQTQAVVLHSVVVSVMFAAKTGHLDLCQSSKLEDYA